MSRRATFWSFLDGGSCRLCARGGVEFAVVNLGRVVGRGDALRARNRLIDHCRSWHPEYVAPVERGDVLGLLDTVPGAKVERATVVDNLPAVG